MNQTYMKEKPILPLLLSLSLPMMLSMLVNSLYNIVDSIFIARISEEALTALSLVYPVQNLISSIAVGFGVGINAVIALHLGAGKNKRADAAATQGMLLGAGHGILMTVLGLAFIPGFLKLFTSDPEVIDLGLRYSVIVLSFSVIIMVGITFEKIFQAVGKMLVSMLVMICGCIVNVILDQILIFGWGIIPEMGIEGAAWATGIGQTVTLIIYLAVYHFRPLAVRLQGDSLKPEKKMCFHLYAIGIPATLNMALPSLLVSVLNAMLASLGQSYVVVLGIYYKLQTFLYLPANGIVQGMRPLLGYNRGAGEHQRVRDIYRISLLLIAAIMGIGMLLCLAVPDRLIGMFTENPGTIEAGTKALRIISFGFVVSAVSVTAAGALEGLGKGLQSFLISLLRYLVVIVPAAYFLGRLYGASGIWQAFWIAEAVTALAAFYIYKKYAIG